MHTTMKRILSTILLSAVFAATAFGISVPANAVQITDLDECAGFARPAVEYLIDKGIIVGNNGKFNPADTLTRDQMVKMLVESMDIDISNPPATPSFIDVAPTHWSFPYVEAALREGIIKMNASKTFVPGQKATREQMSAMFVRALGLTDEQLLVNQTLDAVTGLADANAVSKWAQDSVEFSLNNGLMNGIGNEKFGPQLDAQRQQAAVVIYRFIMAKDSLQQKVADFSKEIQFPEFYDSIKNPVEKESFIADLNSSFCGRDLGSDDEYTEFLSTHDGITGFVNGKDFSIEDTGFVRVWNETTDFYYCIIFKNGKFYYNPGEMGWQLLSPQELIDAGISITSLQNITPDNSGFLRNYNKLPITKSIEVVGETTYTVYSLRFDQSNYDQYGLTNTEELIQSDEKISDVYNNGFEITYQMFINENGLIEKGKVFISGNSLDESIALDMLAEVSVDIDYFDLGRDIPVIAPAIK